VFLCLWVSVHMCFVSLFVFPSIFFSVFLSLLYVSFCVYVCCDISMFNLCVYECGCVFFHMWICVSVFLSVSSSSLFYLYVIYMYLWSSFPSITISFPII
jgi:hypothetical protein